MSDSNGFVSAYIHRVRAANPAQPRFIQAVEEVLRSIEPVLRERPEFRNTGFLDRLVEPERVVMFRVPWMDDHGEIQVNRGYRVQFNSALGPYKGGIRFHASVNLDALKFLGFEQIIKNALTGLPMGGGKGGADFSVRGKSDDEIMRFCQSFMTRLYRHIGPDTDVPAGDIGVSGRELGYLFGHYKSLTWAFEGVLTGKGHAWGGSLVRREATGYGAAYFASEMLATRGLGFPGMRVAVSGAGVVAQHALEKIVEMGGKVVTISDEFGYLVDDAGFDAEKVQRLKEAISVRRETLADYAKSAAGVRYTEGHAGKWDVPVDIALPCAIENELDGRDARSLVDNGCICVAEGANMPCLPEAIEVFQDRGILYSPGKAVNAGGVAVSGLEMSQNSQRFQWGREEIDARLRALMTRIHSTCLETAERYGRKGDYVLGANVAGFLRVAETMLEQGVV